MQATPHIFEAITDAGIDPAKARRLERAIAEDQTNRLMTKEDGLLLEQRLEQKIESVRSELKEDGQRLTNKLETVRSELGQKIDAMSSRLLTAIGVGTAIIAALIALMTVIVTFHK